MYRTVTVLQISYNVFVFVISIDHRRHLYIYSTTSNFSAVLCELECFVSSDQCFATHAITKLSASYGYRCMLQNTGYLLVDSVVYFIYITANYLSYFTLIQRRLGGPRGQRQAIVRDNHNVQNMIALSFYSSLILSSEWRFLKDFLTPLVEQSSRVRDIGHRTIKIAMRYIRQGLGKMRWSVRSAIHTIKPA